MSEITSTDQGFFEKYLWAPLRFSWESLKYGLDVFKAKAGFFIALTVVLALVTAVPDYIVGKVFEQGSALRVISELILRLIGLFLGMVTTRISLDLYDTGETNLSKIGDLIPQFLPYLGGKIIYGIIVLVGLVLLVFPGLIVSYMFLYVGYLIIDRNLGPIEALKESKNVTYGYKWTLFIFSLVIAFVNILGVFCLLLGLLVSIPVTLMASVYVYRQLSPSQTAVAAQA